jgi:hypothetical protein
MMKSLKCLLCSHEWIALFPDGHDSNTVECPNCHKEFEAISWNKITSAEDNTSL